MSDLKNEGVKYTKFETESGTRNELVPACVIAIKHAGTSSSVLYKT